VFRKFVFAFVTMTSIIGVLIAAVYFGGPALLRFASDTTQYSTGYSETAFESVRVGMTQAEVIELLGAPLGTHEATPGVVRWYGPPGSSVGEDSGLHTPSGSNAKSGIFRFDLNGQFTDSGESAENIRAEYGEPIKEKVVRAVIIWRYSWSPQDGNYHRRWIGFDIEGKVSEKKAYFWWD